MLLKSPPPTPKKELKIILTKLRHLPLCLGFTTYNVSLVKIITLLKIKIKELLATSLAPTTSGSYVQSYTLLIVLSFYSERKKEYSLYYF